MKLIKTPEDSRTIMTNIVLPSETNDLNNMFGGELLARMDRACSIAARRHAESHKVVTASVNHVSFFQPIPEGSIVKLEAKITRAFRTSMEIFVDVWWDDPIKQTLTKTNEGIYTFVAVNENNRPIEVPQLKPESEEEKERFDAALRRKQLSLVLGGRLEPCDATELRSLFKEKE